MAKLLLSDLVSKQGGAFEHPAELLFVGAPVCAGAALEALKNLVADLQAFQMYDADKFIAAFPGLPLFEFHAITVGLKRPIGHR